MSLFMPIQNFIPALFPYTSCLPEIVLASSAVLTLLFGSLLRCKNLIMWVFFALTTVLLVYLLGIDSMPRVVDDFYFAQPSMQPLRWLVLLGIVGSGAALAVSRDAQVRRFETIVLMFFSAVGMLMALSAVSYAGLYVALELQSLPAYILCALRRDHAKSVEASVKYFIAGGFASALMLFGIALMYANGAAVGEMRGFSFGILSAMADAPQQFALARLGAGLLFAGIAFKASAAPLHMWTPDVYQNAPLPTTIFLAVASKVTAFAVLWQQVVSTEKGAIFALPALVLAVLSTVFGLAGAMAQTDARRLLAFSSVQHGGFIFLLLSLSASVPLERLYGVFLGYLSAYLPATLLVFLIFALLRKENGDNVSALSDFRGLAKQHPIVSAALTVGLLSMAGIPPLAGFFVKFATIYMAMAAGHVLVPMVLVLASAVAAYYYLQIVRAIYFDAPEADNAITLVAAPIWVRLLLVALTLYLVVFLAFFAL